tara:strand:- start:12787 stop:13458 length:672 start_codon:yes stop_codon:yes gene_type:complete
MRPVKIGTLTPLDTDTVFFNAQGFTSEGAAVAPTTTSTTDGLAHKVTLTAPVQATLAGITFIILGTDGGNNPVQESIVGPASGATVTTSRQFRTIVSIQPSATMGTGAGALTLAVGITANEAITEWVNLENTTSSAMIFVHVTGTINYTVFQTPANIFIDYPQDVNDSEFYLNLGAPIGDLTTKTVDTLANANNSCRAVLLRVNSFTAGATITFYVNSAGGGY